MQGARWVNNLKDVSLELPKRRLTVFTGVSGSGKSSLVFGTIAAESQRLINETYSAFVQGFMPTMARPDVDVLEGLTTAIVVDQERMGGGPRSTVGTVTDANALLRILFSRLGQPHVGSPNAYSFNVPSISAKGGMTVEKGDRKVVAVSFSRTGGMCPRCEGMCSISDLDLTSSSTTPSRSTTARSRSGLHRSGWMVRTYAESGFFDPDTPIREFTDAERHDFLYREPVKVKAKGINVTYEGLIPKIQKSFFSKDRDALQPHIPRVRSSAPRRGHVPGLRRHPPRARGARVEDRWDQHRRCLRHADHRSRPVDPTSSRSHRWRRCSARSATCSMRSSRSASGTCRSTVRRAR